MKRTITLVCAVLSAGCMVYGQTPTAKNERLAFKATPLGITMKDFMESNNFTIPFEPTPTFQRNILSGKAIMERQPGSNGMNDTVGEIPCFTSYIFTSDHVDDYLAIFDAITTREQPAKNAPPTPFEVAIGRMKLESVLCRLKRGDFDKILTVVVAKYGKPTRDLSRQEKDSEGEMHNCPQYIWEFNDSALTLHESHLVRGGESILILNDFAKRDPATPEAIKEALLKRKAKDL